MRVVSLSDPPFKKRDNEYYETKRADWIGKNPKTRQLVDGMEKRILQIPESVGRVSVDPPGTRHVHVGSHGVIWWRVFPREEEVEFIDIGHWDDFFG
jgi:hypothetical protein